MSGGHSVSMSPCHWEHVFRPWAPRPGSALAPGPEAQHPAAGRALWGWEPVQTTRTVCQASPGAEDPPLSRSPKPVFLRTWGPWVCLEFVSSELSRGERWLGKWGVSRACGVGGFCQGGGPGTSSVSIVRETGAGSRPTQGSHGDRWASPGRGCCTSEAPPHPHTALVTSHRRGQSPESSIRPLRILSWPAPGCHGTSAGLNTGLPPPG